MLTVDNLRLRGVHDLRRRLLRHEHSVRMTLLRNNHLSSGWDGDRLTVDVENDLLTCRRGRIIHEEINISCCVLRGLNVRGE